MTPLTVVQHHKGIPIVVPVNVVHTLDTPSRYLYSGLLPNEEIIVMRREHPSTREHWFTALVRIYAVNPDSGERVVRAERTVGDPKDKITKRTTVYARSETALIDLRTTLAQA